MYGLIEDRGVVLGEHPLRPGLYMVDEGNFARFVRPAGQEAYKTGDVVKYSNAGQADGEPRITGLAWEE